MPIADDIFEQLRTAQHSFAAGVRAADESGFHARKLAALLAVAEDVVARLEIYYDDTERVRFERDRLRVAIREARR